MRYVREQHDFDQERVRLKLSAFEKLLHNVSNTSGPIPIAVRVQSGKIVIVDGLHRAAIAHALGRTREIQLNIVGRGGELVV